MVFARLSGYLAGISERWPSMKAMRQFVAFPFVLGALVGVSICLGGISIMVLFGAIADWVEGK